MGYLQSIMGYFGVVAYYFGLLGVPGSSLHWVAYLDDPLT